MANVAINNRGWLDTRERINDVLKADEFLTQLITRHAEIPLVKAEGVGIISAATQLLCGARYLANQKPPRSLDYIKALVIGELMAPVLPASMSLQARDATAEFEKICTYLLNNETVYNRGRTATAWIAEINAINDRTPEGQRLAVPDPAAYSRQDYQHYLLWLAYQMPKAQYMDAIQLVVTSYIGAAKRGTVSERFVDKIITGIKADLGEDVLIDAEIISTTYNCFGRYITATNARDVFDRWLNDIPEHALRLRLTLQQTSGSGLTAFLTTGRAMKKFSDFKWGRLEKLTNGELTAYLEALVVVGGNPYFGFNRDLKAAKSTKYSSVAYVAKELLIQLAGEISLKNYQGWVKKPKAATVIKQLIDDYVAKYNEDLSNIEVSQIDAGVQRSVLETVASETNINLFA